MNKKILFLAFLVLTVIMILNFYNPQFIPSLPEGNPAPVGFLYGAIHTIDDGFNNYANYDQLGLGVWHTYVDGEYGQIQGRQTPKGPTRYNFWPQNDQLMTPVSEYASALTAIINQIYLQHNNSRILWQRPKIEWLAYGQRSDYQCEEIVGTTNPLWFYSFKEHGPGTDIPDQGAMVRYCQLGSGAGLVVSKLKANTEQSKMGGVADATNLWQFDHQCNWFVKPKIRILPSFIPGHEETDVCTIYIKKQDGTDKIPSKTIKVKHLYPVNHPELYTGDYIEEFYFTQQPGEIPAGVPFPGELGDKWVLEARGDRPENEIVNHADIQVEWHGNCDMWIDYVRVDSDVANDLFAEPPNPTTLQYRQWIQQEADIAKHIPPGASEPAVWKFYVELTEFNNLPCINYLNTKLREYTGGKIDFISDFCAMDLYHVNWATINTISSPEWIYNNFVLRGGYTAIYGGESYPFTSTYHEPPTNTYSKIPNTLPRTTCGGSNWCGILAFPAPPAEYDAWLQDNFNHTPYWTESGVWGPPPPGSNPCWPFELPQDAGRFRWIMKTFNRVSQLGNIPFILMCQGHLWLHPWETEREPTNEELEMMANLSVSYGSKGHMWWSYGGFDDYDDPDCPKHHRGMTNPGNVLRTNNFYDEAKPKSETFRDIGDRMRTWEPYIMSFQNSEINSFIYNEPGERTSMRQLTYIDDIYTYPADCPDQDPLAIPDPENERYVQVASFDQLGYSNEKYERYFMIVNRRCAPHRPEISECGGLRNIKIKFFTNPGRFGFYRFNNINLVDLETNQIAATFDKSTNNGYPIVNLGWFEPGEGKIYKLVPTLLSGGTLLTDEWVGTEGIPHEYDVTGTVYNGGKNIYIFCPVTLNFHENTGFVINGGEFYGGDQSCDGVFRGKNGAKWNGITLVDNTFSTFWRLTFSDIKEESYAINISNCGYEYISHCNFSCDEYSGAIQADYTSGDGDDSPTVRGYVTNCNFTMASGEGIPALRISSYAGMTLPVIIEWNNFTCSSGDGVAVMLSNITGASVKNNTMSNFGSGIWGLNSGFYAYNNTITNNSMPSFGISASAGSIVIMRRSGDLWLGGLNRISNPINDSYNLYVENSEFYIDEGENEFNFSSGGQSYHLYGYFPYSSQYDYLCRKNCFKIDSYQTQNPVNLVTYGYGGYPIDFEFLPFKCNREEPFSYILVDVGDGNYDTIYTYSGSGGSLSSSSPMVTLESLYDSLNIATRKRDYVTVTEQANRLLLLYPDSIQSLDAVSKLYLAVTTSDTSSAGINNLKSTYESLILAHPDNISLVKQCNYYIQKCKVQLKQYSSAMAGFLAIMQGSPNTYEGLLAHWDYMATHLLDSLSAGAVSGEGDDDKNNRFTKEQRQQIKQSVHDVLEIVKNTEKRETEILEELSIQGNENAKRELDIRNALSNVIKPRTPHDILEHVRIVNDDIKQIADKNRGSQTKKVNEIPMVFSLSQNYPNPFNPVTKINYDIPKNSIVKLIIYDVLGREVMKLVNNEFKQPGKYVVEFNGTNLASGVYFYRIEAGNFVEAKKMVLVK